jgi:polyisoprenoid-binding protein YceI
MKPPYFTGGSRTINDWQPSGETSMFKGQAQIRFVWVRPLVTTLLGTLMAAALPAMLAAAPTRYILDAKSSQVGFSFTLGGTQQNGTMPVSKAVILVDPDNLRASRVDISVNVTGVRTPLPFARKALIGAEVLDAARYPTIRFVSTKVQLAADGRLSGGAKISGKLTMHGVTRPVTLEAGLFRAQGSAPDDLSTLTVQLKGQIYRSEFGATGYKDLVADAVRLNIVAEIRATR